MTFLLLITLAIDAITTCKFADRDGGFFTGFLLPVTGLFTGFLFFVVTLVTILNNITTPILVKYQEDSVYITTHLNSEDGHERVNSANLALKWNKEIEENRQLRDNIWVGIMYPDTIGGLHKFNLSKCVVDSVKLNEKEGN